MKPYAQYELREFSFSILKEFLVIVVILSLAWCGCASGKATPKKVSERDTSKQVKYVCANRSYPLTAEEMYVMERKAKTGDGQAAYRLYLYYGFGLNDHPTCALYWLNFAATNGCNEARLQLESQKRFDEAQERLKRELKWEKRESPME